MDSLSSSASAVPGVDDNSEHNVWNLELEFFFLQYISGIFASYLVEIDLAKITLSCHVALDLLLLQGGGASFCTMKHWARSSLCFCSTIATLVSSCFFCVWSSLQISVPHLFFLLLEQFPLVWFRIHMWHW